MQVEPEKKFEPNLQIKAEAQLIPNEDVVIIQVELQPGTPFQHEMLAAILDHEERAGLDLHFVNKSVGDLLKFEVVLEHAEIVAKATVAIAMKKEAEDRGISVDQLLAEKEAQEYSARVAAEEKRLQEEAEKAAKEAGTIHEMTACKCGHPQKKHDPECTVKKCSCEAFDAVLDNPETSGAQQQ